MDAAKRILALVTTVLGASGPGMVFETAMQIIKFIGHTAEKLGESDANLDVLEAQVKRMVREQRGPTEEEWAGQQADSDELGDRIKNA